MASILVKYSDNTTTIVTGTSVALVATTTGLYQHSSKQVSALEFTLGSATSGTVAVSPASGSQPAQTCSSSADPGHALPFDAAWSVSSTGIGTLTLTIPSSSSDTYLGRLAITGGGKVDITVEH